MIDYDLTLTYDVQLSEVFKLCDNSNLVFSLVNYSYGNSVPTYNLDTTPTGKEKESNMLRYKGSWFIKRIENDWFYLKFTSSVFLS